MRTNNNFRCLVLVASCLNLAGSVQAEETTKPGSTEAFSKESRDLLYQVAKLQLSEVAGYGNVARCGPKPPTPDGCPPACPPPTGMNAFRSYGEGKASNIAAGIVIGSSIGTNLICDPRPIEKELNALLKRLDRIGAWVVKTDSGGVTITREVPPLSTDRGMPERKATAARDRAFAALNYMNGEFAKGREPPIREQ